jgi:hypothetical protein
MSNQNQRKLRVELKTRNELQQVPMRTQSFVLGKTKLPPAANSINKRKATLSLLENLNGDKQEALNIGRTMSVKPEPTHVALQQTLTDYSKIRHHPLY